MSESIWWPDEAWWERKVLPLGFVTLSFRQLGTIAFAILSGYLISLSFQFPIAGFSFGGRAASFGIVFGLGYIVSNRRVRLLPIELQTFYLLRTRGIETARARLRELLGVYERKSVLTPPSASTPSLEMVVEDFKNPVPLVISDRLNDVRVPTRAQLFFDGQLRAEDLVSPQKPRYRLSYVPLPEDVGTHDLSVVRLDALPEPLLKVNLALIAKNSAEIEEGSVVVRIGMRR